MERVRGVILRGDKPPAGITCSPELMRRTSTALVDNLADLHAVDVSRPPLSGIGKPAGYVERQVTGWTERYFNAKTDEIPGVEARGDLAGAQHAEGERRDRHPQRLQVRQRDARPADITRIVAVLDWEMATVGDPLMDLGSFIGYWGDPDDPDELRARAYGPTYLPGSLSRLQLVERYAERSGRAVGSILFYYVFALFKIAVIVQQIYKRYVEGSTRDPRFATLIDWVRVMAHQAERALEKGRVDRLGERR